MGTPNLCCAQGEFKFYMQDAASKLLIVPARGNKASESAASSLTIPIAAISLGWTDGEDATLHTASLYINLYSMSHM